MKKANAIIEEKYTDNTFLPSHLAPRLHISYSHCAHLVKQKTGLSISLYIQQYHLVKAKELLRTTDLPIKQVAYQSGFILHHFRFCAFAPASPQPQKGRTYPRCTKPKVVQYNNPSYFSRLFKEAMGISPSGFRSNGLFTEKSR
ncbi:MAG TPA: AraC family transcriptional regulator [Bacteroidetes bacterium]|nr:AraC family transcriptional regulator [Bacteroidota bacterium]